MKMLNKLSNKLSSIINYLYFSIYTLRYNIKLGCKFCIHGKLDFTRYYLAATKHFSFAGVGTLGVHAAYVDYRACWFPHYRRPAAGVNFKFNLLPEDNLAVKALNGLDLMAEYDARTVNIGAHYQLWKDHINLIAELNNGKYFSGGIYFKIHLK